MEVWKDIPGFEGHYQASSDGRVRSLDRDIPCAHGATRRVKGRILTPARYDKTGHVSVVLGHGAHGSPVHRLVARAFLGAQPEGCEVLHMNGDPKDNRVVNLRYGTRTENILDVYNQGGKWRTLTADQAVEIKKRLQEGETGASIAKAYGVSKSCISDLKRGKTFAWLNMCSTSI